MYPWIVPTRKCPWSKMRPSGVSSKYWNNLRNIIKDNQLRRENNTNMEKSLDKLDEIKFEFERVEISLKLNHLTIVRLLNS